MDLREIESDYMNWIHLAEDRYQWRALVFRRCWIRVSGGIRALLTEGFGVFFKSGKCWDDASVWRLPFPSSFRIHSQIIAPLGAININIIEQDISKFEATAELIAVVRSRCEYRDVFLETPGNHDNNVSVTIFTGLCN
jgi:hypothetical protein